MGERSVGGVMLLKVCGLHQPALFCVGVVPIELASQSLFVASLPERGIRIFGSCAIFL